MKSSLRALNMSRTQFFVISIDKVFFCCAINVNTNNYRLKNGSLQCEENMILDLFHLESGSDKIV